MITFRTPLVDCNDRGVRPGAGRPFLRHSSAEVRVGPLVTRAFRPAGANTSFIP